MLVLVYDIVVLVSSVLSMSQDGVSFKVRVLTRFRGLLVSPMYILVVKSIW